MKTAVVAVLLLISPPAPAGEWWQEDGGRSWGTAGNGGDAAWAESREDAWWLDDANTAPRAGYGPPRGGDAPRKQPWGLRSTPPERAQGREQARKTYNPWSSGWSERPWGDTGSRSERDRESSKRKSSRRPHEGVPRDGGVPAYRGYGPAPRYPSGHVPGPAAGPWGPMPVLPPMPAPY